METAAKMMGPYFDSSLRPVGSLIDLTKETGQPDIVDIFVTAEMKETAGGR